MAYRASYRDSDGKVRQVSRYTANVELPGGGRAKVTGYSSRKATEALERNLERLAACCAEGDRPDRKLRRYLDGLSDRIRARLVKLGILEQRAQQRSRLLTNALDDFGRYLAAKGDTLLHAEQQPRRARRVLVGECGFRLLSDVTAEPVLLALAKLREPQVKNGQEKPGIKATTSNMLRQACRGFTRWAAREGRLPEDPLVYLDRVEAEPKSNRRALTAQEQARLVAITKGQHTRGLSGLSRAMLYTLALQTGLRRGELLSLRRSNFELDGESPAVVIEHGRTKNRKRARLPLRPETTAELRAFLRDRLPAARVFRASPHYRAAEVLAKDLEAAGIERDGEGGCVDFHALRVTFVSSLALAGVPLAQAQKLARHSTPMLTANVYSRFAPDEDAAAIAKLPSLADAAG